MQNINEKKSSILIVVVVIISLVLAQTLKLLMKSFLLMLNLVTTKGWRSKDDMMLQSTQMKVIKNAFMMCFTLLALVRIY
jgi:predicted membrane protein